jgi:hypothetical protein
MSTNNQAVAVLAEEQSFAKYTVLGAVIALAIGVFVGTGGMRQFRRRSPMERLADLFKR